MPSPIALIGADYHFSDKRPICRKEEDWFEYQKSVLNFLKDVCDEHDIVHVVVGDIFDRSRHSNELVNLVIDNLPVSYVTAGNHDLPYHNMELNGKSAYGCLTRSKVATQMDEPISFDESVFLHPFHFGQKYHDCPEEFEGFNIALIHELIWETPPFEDAPKKGNVENLVKRLKGYDMIICGDNHEHFITEVDGVVIMNCGSLMRLTAAQVDYQPKVHLLYSDGSLKSIDVPCDNDLISREHLDVKKKTEREINKVVNKLKNKKDGEKYLMSFEERVERAIVVSEITPKVIEIIKENMV